MNKVVEKKVSELFKELGAFFCFSESQFNENKVDGQVYVDSLGGLLIPEQNVVSLHERLGKIYEDGRKDELAKKGKAHIIREQLYNHECFYTYDITDVVEYLEAYGITELEIQTKFEEMCEQQRQRDEDEDQDGAQVD
jgi:hypothetical protein